MGYSLGVDLGTTFTAVAVDHADRIEMLTLGDRTVVVPTVVFARQDGVVITGDTATRRALSHPTRIGREFKRRLGDPTPLMLGETPYSAVALLGYVLRDVLQKVTEIEGEKPEHVLLTHPANWGPYRRELFEEVPRLAGLDESQTVTEPEAAAAYYSTKQHLDDGDVVAVYDLGGGTFDATVVRKLSDGIEILGHPDGIERLGGVDFDEAIMAHVDCALNGALAESTSQDPQVATALRRLRQDCVEAKETLSVDTETTIPVFLPHMHCEVRLTRSDFEDMIRPLIEATIEALRRALRSAQVDPSELASVLLVGGSSRIPMVAQMVSEEFGSPTAVDVHPKYAVALGAAALAASRKPPERATASLEEEPPEAPSPDLVRDSARATAVPATTIPHSAASKPEPGVAEAAGSTGGRERRPPEGPPPPAEPGHRAGDGGGRRGSRSSRRKAALLGAGALVVLGLLLALFTFPPGSQVAQSPGPASIIPGRSTTPPAVGKSLAAPAVDAAIGVAGPRGIAITPDGKNAYVTSKGASRLSVIDTATGEVTTSRFMPVPPQYVAFTPDGRRAYVSCYPERGPENIVMVLDTATNDVISEIPVGLHPYTPAATPDGREIYVPNHDIASVSVIDTETDTMTATIGVAPNPHSVTFTPDGRSAYVASHESNLVSVIDTATRAVTSTIPVPKSPHSVAMAPGGERVMVGSFDAASASIIDTGSNTVNATIGVGAEPSSVAWAPDGRHAYVVNEGSDSLSVIDTSTNRVTANVPVGAEPVAVAVTPNGRRAYVTNNDSNTVAVLTTAR